MTADAQGQPYRPEAESHFALPHHEFGPGTSSPAWDAYATTNTAVSPRSTTNSHAAASSSPNAPSSISWSRTVTRNCAPLAAADPQRLQRHAAGATRCRPGHRWLATRCGSRGSLGSPRLCLGRSPPWPGAYSPLPPPTWRRCCPRCARPCRSPSRVSSRTASRRSARPWAQELPGVPHQLCHFHYLREAVLGRSYEADRHAKKELKKRIRGVRPIERSSRRSRRGRCRGGVSSGLLCAAVRSRLDRRRATAAGGLEGCACTSGWKPSPPAWTGSRRRRGRCRAG